MTVPRRLALALTAALTLAVTASCSAGSDSAGTGGPLTVVTGFYPLQYAVEQVGGDHVEVVNLTAPGAEPHDVELTPRDVARVAEADLAVYEKLLQPAVDDAVTQQSPAHVLEVGEAARLSLRVTESIGGEPHADEHESHSEPPTPGSGSTAEGADDHEHTAEVGAIDPHFWLDPQRYDAVAQQIAGRLAEIDPERAADYRSNAAAFSSALSALDSEFAAGLRQCASRSLVTSHAAFGYLADRYKFTQVPISGLSPDAEPEPARLARIADYVRTNRVRTIYTETLVSPAVARTVADETGATTAVLDPIEGLTDASAGADYPAIMRANLATLRTGQACS